MAQRVIEAILAKLGMSWKGWRNHFTLPVLASLAVTILMTVLAGLKWSLIEKSVLQPDQFVSAILGGDPMKWGVVLGTLIAMIIDPTKSSLLAGLAASILSWGGYPDHLGVWPAGGLIAINIVAFIGGLALAKMNQAETVHTVHAATPTEMAQHTTESHQSQVQQTQAESGGVDIVTTVKGTPTGLHPNEVALYHQQAQDGDPVAKLLLDAHKDHQATHLFGIPAEIIEKLRHPQESETEKRRRMSLAPYPQDRKPFHSRGIKRY